MAVAGTWVPHPHSACAFPPPSLSHQASRKALSLFYLAEPWDNNWTGFNWPGNQSPKKNASWLLPTSCSLPVPVLDKQPCQCLNLWGEVHSVCGSHIMEVMYFSGTAPARATASPIMWLMKGFSPPGLEGSWSVCNKGVCLCGFLKKNVCACQNRTFLRTWKSRPACLPERSKAPSGWKGEKFHWAGPLATAQGSLPLSQRHLFTVARLASLAISYQCSLTQSGRWGAGKAIGGECFLIREK